MTPRARLAALTEAAAFPLDKADLVELVERAGDLDLLDVVVTLQDDRYVSSDELDHRIEDALGVPETLPDSSAADPGTGWRADN
jgi:hypothetical protein